MLTTAALQLGNVHYLLYRFYIASLRYHSSRCFPIFVAARLPPTALPETGFKLVVRVHIPIPRVSLLFCDRILGTSYHLRQEAPSSVPLCRHDSTWTILAHSLSTSGCGSINMMFISPLGFYPYRFRASLVQNLSRALHLSSCHFGQLHLGYRDAAVQHSVVRTLRSLLMQHISLYNEAFLGPPRIQE